MVFGELSISLIDYTLPLLLADALTFFFLFCSIPMLGISHFSVKGRKNTPEPRSPPASCGRLHGEGSLGCPVNSAQ